MISQSPNLGGQKSQTCPKQLKLMKYDEKIKINFDFVGVTTWEWRQIIQNGFLGGVIRVPMHDLLVANRQQSVVDSSRKGGKKSSNVAYIKGGSDPDCLYRTVQSYNALSGCRHDCTATAPKEELGLILSA